MRVIKGRILTWQRGNSAVAAYRHEKLDNVYIQLGLVMPADQGLAAPVGTGNLISKEGDECITFKSDMSKSNDCTSYHLNMYLSLR